MPRSFQSQCLFAFLLAATAPVAAQEPRDNVTAPTGAHYRAREILGSTVSITGDLTVGTVDDFVVDVAGRVAYLIVTNPQKQFITVPWSAARFNIEKRAAVLSITLERFRAIPTYTADTLPKFSDPNYRTQIDQYYGISPEGRRFIKRGNPGIVK